MNAYARRPLFRLLGLSADLGRLESEAAQRDAWARVCRRNGGRGWLAALILLLFVGPILALALALVLLVLASLFLRTTFKRRLRRHLCDVGLPTCLPCGYDLTGNTSKICPECGAPTDK